MLLQQPDGIQPGEWNNFKDGKTARVLIKKTKLRTCGGPGLSSPKLKLVAKNPKGNAPAGIEMKLQLKLILPPIPKDMWKPPGWPPPKPNPKTIPIIGDSHHKISQFSLWKGKTKTWEWVICGWLCPLALRSWRHLFPGYTLSTEFSLILSTVLRNVKLPGIFAVSITPAIQGNYFVFANASLQWYFLG